MNTNHTDHITLGRNIQLTYAVLAGIHKRQAREYRRSIFRKRCRDFITRVFTFRKP